MSDERRCMDIDASPQNRHEYTTQTGRSRQRQAVLRNYYFAVREGHYDKALSIRSANIDWISFKEFDVIAGRIMDDPGYVFPYAESESRSQTKRLAAQETPIVRSADRGTAGERES